MAPPALDPAAPDVAGRHLLVLPADVEPVEVEILAVSRFPRAAWEVDPGTTPEPGSGRGGRGGGTAAGVLRLSRHSTLTGPFTVDRGTVTALGLPTAVGTAYVVTAPTERGDPPWPTGGDRDGLRRAFPHGLPVRDEERVVGWLIAAARRLGGGVRVPAAEPDEPPVLLVPDPAAAVDLTVWSDIWLDPAAALTVARQALPRAELNLPAGGWAGPPTGTGVQPVRGTEEMDAADRRALHLAADERDLAVLRDPPPMQAYGALADLELDGIIALEVAGETSLPPVIAAIPWAARGAVTYRVRWEPFELEEMEAERPSLTHRVARSRATPLVIALTRAVHNAVGGEITDAMDFVVDPADL